MNFVASENTLKSKMTLDPSSEPTEMRKEIKMSMESFIEL